MTNQRDLDEIINSTQNPFRSPSAIRGYLVDTSASWLYWTPIGVISELVAGLETPEILKSRATSLLINMAVARPFGFFRQYWSNLWDTTVESSLVRKLVVDTTALWCFQIPSYSLQLYLSGASLKEGTAALAIGVASSAILGRPYGFFQDKWRKSWGVKPVLSA